MYLSLHAAMTVCPEDQHFYIHFLNSQLGLNYDETSLLCSLTCHWVAVPSYTLKGRHVPPNRAD